MPLLTKTGLEKIKHFTEDLKILREKVNTVGFGADYYTFVAAPVISDKAILDGDLCLLHYVNNQILFQTSYGTGVIIKEKLKAEHWEAILGTIKQAADPNSKIDLSPELRQALVKTWPLSLHVELSLGVSSDKEASEYAKKTLNDLIFLLEELTKNNDARYWNSQEKAAEVFAIVNQFTGKIGHYVPACFDLLSFEIAKIYDNFLCSIDLKTDVVTDFIQRTVINSLNPKFIHYVSDNTKQHIRLFKMAMIEYRRKIIEQYADELSLSYYKKYREINDIMEATERLLTFIQITQCPFTSNSNRGFLVETCVDASTKKTEFLFEGKSGEQYKIDSENKLVKNYWPEICAALVDEKVKNKDKDLFIELVKQEYAKLYSLETVDPWSLFSLSVDSIMQHYAEKIGVLMTEFLKDHSAPEKTILTLDQIIDIQPNEPDSDSLQVITGTKEFVISGFLVYEKNILQQAHQLGKTNFQGMILTKVKENFVFAKEEYRSLMNELFTTIQTIKKELSDYAQRRKPTIFRLYQTPEKNEISEDIIKGTNDALAKTETQNISGVSHPPLFHNYLNALLSVLLSASIKHTKLLRKKENISHGELGEIITANLAKVYNLLDKISLKCNPGVFYDYLSSTERLSIDIPTLGVPVSNGKTFEPK